ncbi:hypothetical protein C8F04DRAFT_1178322 [Mycena alexandri]|uniref:Uncharacterized protein n=1 Tax=Mycena alexandri TaxID=1745969 RepID=A0AAD6T6U7_9AGAR|nr:hypothetical protein C8F04DRAFT_1178322 [Mycena alexandri]
MAWLSAGSHQYREDTRGRGESANKPICGPLRSLTGGPLDSALADEFWKKVAEVTTRYRDSDNKWVAGQEIQQWHNANRQGSPFNNVLTDLLTSRLQACNKCANSRSNRNLFDSNYTMFLKYYGARAPLQMKRYKQVENAIRKGNRNTESVNAFGSDSGTAGSDDSSREQYFKEAPTSIMLELGLRMELLESQLRESRAREAAAVQRELDEKSQHGGKWYPTKFAGLL